MKFSIVIPAYNIEDYIGKCLDSILSQTYSDYEIIVVNDGSTDNTGRVLDEYKKKDSRITVIHKENEGVSIARNTGMELATGEYFLFFDGDDFVEPYCLADLAKIVERGEYDTVIYGYHRFEDGKIKETCPPIFEKRHYIGNEIMSELFPKFIGISDHAINDWLNHKDRALYVENPALWHVMTKVSVIKDNGLKFNKNLRVGEDTMFVSEYLSYAESVYVEKKCYYYLVTRTTSTIFVYEKKPLQKLEGKIRLLTARKELTSKIDRRFNIDVTKEWAGTVIMSCIELAFLLSAPNKEYGYFKRYREFLKYIKLPGVEKMISDYKVDAKFSVNVIPFWFLKAKMYFILFLATTVLNIAGYKFKRS
ncbi:MAG: glycosyltransferase family 2 protein [Lachnospiraceae bacterium]|nr:glycosyltransferase family 2 protein [Lachnospiraceae bacterium]